MFTAEYKLLNDLFGNDIKYKIPSYQRPYSWECLGKSDKNNQINRFWIDLIDHFDARDPNPYFMGSMVFIGKEEQRDFEVIDGQQRLTSFLILLVSVKCFLSDLREKNQYEDESINQFIINAIDVLDNFLFNKILFGVATKEKKVRIEHNEGFNFDKILKDVMECKIEPNYFDANEEEKEICKRYFDNRLYFIERLKEKFTQNEWLTFQKAEELNYFIDFLKNKIAIIRVLTEKFEMAYQIFEILNNRGLQLSNKDLVRNFLISEHFIVFQNKQVKEPKILANEKWHHLNNIYQFDNEFITRFVESYTGKAQKYSAFNNLKLIYENYQNSSIELSKIESFYQIIENYLLTYTKIVRIDFQDKEIYARLQFLLNTDNLTYSLDVLMALLVNFKDEKEISEFIKTYERFICYQMLGPSKRFSVTPIFNSIEALNQKNFEAARSFFELQPNELKVFENLFNLDFKDNDLAKLFISRYFWFSNLVTSDVLEVNLNYHDATLEHIMPQNPAMDTNWIKDFSKSERTKWTYKLGNMTLLTKKINSKLKNADFELKKKLGYQDAIFPLTRDLAKVEKMDIAFFEKRQDNIQKILKKSFGL